METTPKPTDAGKEFEYAILVHILANADATRESTINTVAKSLAAKHGESVDDAITLAHLVYDDLVRTGKIAHRTNVI